MIKLLCTMFFVTLSAASLGQSGTPSASMPQETSPGEPITTLKVTTRVVAISAVVKSKGGGPQGGLTKDDFVLKQDGKEEPIHYFSQGSQFPLTLALMVDVSGSQRTFIGDESLASDVFFETMLGAKQDRAALVQFDANIAELRGMTNSPGELHLALTRLSSRPATAGETLLNDAVYSVAKTLLASESGRKAMVILSDGGDRGSHHSLAEAIEQAQRADVQIYSIRYSLWDSFSGMASPRPPGGDSGLVILNKLSDSTGGRVFTVNRTTSLREIFAQIGQDLRTQYEIGYTPPSDIQPNTYHRLELRAKDKKFTVQARNGFFAQQ